MFYLIAIVIFLFSIVSWISNYNIQVYRLNIGPIYSIERLSKTSNVGLYKALLALSSGRSFQRWWSLIKFLYMVYIITVIDLDCSLYIFYKVIRPIFFI